MPLQCQVYVYPSATSGDRPVTVAVVATNPSPTTSIAITGGALSITQLRDGSDVSCALPMLPLGPGMSTVVAAGASVLIGPMPLVVHSNSASNSFQNPSSLIDSQPSDARGEPTGSHYPQFTVLVGATLYGSDGSINQAGTAPILVDVIAPPPLGFQGGFLHLSAPNNLITAVAAGVL